MIFFKTQQNPQNKQELLLFYLFSKMLKTSEWVARAVPPTQLSGCCFRFVKKADWIKIKWLRNQQL
jgi:hypothetical protein